MPSPAGRGTPDDRGDWRNSFAHRSGEPVPQGTVSWFDTERGFGFLHPADGGADLFVHASEIVTDDGVGCGAVARRGDK